MPYIKEDRRIHLRFLIHSLALNINDAGELNYCFSLIIKKLPWDICYTNYNTIIGVLECCKLELYRRMIAPYEEIKIKENGDLK